MKTKKLLSSITALAIAASTFAGFAVTANAADFGMSKYTVTEDFSNATVVSGNVTRQGTVSGTISDSNFNTKISTEVGWNCGTNEVAIKEGYLSVGTSSADANIQAISTTLDMVNAFKGNGEDDNVVSVSFNWYNSNALQAGNQTFVSLKDTSGKEILVISWDRSGTTMHINSNSYGQSLPEGGNAPQSGNTDNYVNRDADGNKWWTVNAVIDFTDHTVKSFTMSRDSGAKSFSFDSVDFVDTTASDVGKISLGILRGPTNVRIEATSRIDDFKITGYVEGYATKFNVTDGKDPITDATVKVKGAAANYDESTIAYDESTSSYTAYIPAKEISYEVSYDGYETVSGTYAVTSDGENIIDVVFPKPVTPPTATYTFIDQFTTETGDDTVDNGSAYNLFVTPGTDTITTVTVKVNGTSADKVATTEINSGSAVFAIAVNALKDEVTSITAVLNGVDYTATEKTE